MTYAEQTAQRKTALAPYEAAIPGLYDLVAFEGQQYSWTGKTGSNLKTGKLGAEFKALENSGLRIWVDEDGAITQD